MNCCCAGFDGTPNESVQDVLVRARQALSIMETQYSEELVIIIAPDSTVLSVLQAALLGIDLRNHWQLAFRCGSVIRMSTSGILRTSLISRAHIYEWNGHK